MPEWRYIVYGIEIWTFNSYQTSVWDIGSDLGDMFVNF